MHTLNLDMDVLRTLVLATDLGSGKVLAHLPLIWVGAEDFVVDPAAPLPLVLPDAPCTMRQKCIDALNRRSRYRQPAVGRQCVDQRAVDRGRR